MREACTDIGTDSSSNTEERGRERGARGRGMGVWVAGGGDA